MKRRQFIMLLGGAAACPVAARTQQPAIPVVGYLVGGLRADDGPVRTAFLRGLGETGFVEGRNVVVEYRYGENQGELLPALAADLVERQVAVIAAEAPADAVASARPKPSPSSS
jgi:putative ABC transport system substrate-binding protein